MRRGNISAPLLKKSALILLKWYWDTGITRSIVAPAENTKSDWLVSIVDKTGRRTGHFLLEEEILTTALFNG